MKTIPTLFFLLAIAGVTSLRAQEEVTVSVGNNYSNQAYYNIDTDAVTTLDNESWDLAFSTGPTDGGIFLNEATKAVFSGTIPDLKLWLGLTTDFSDPIDPGTLTDSLFNEEEDWQNGAFNSFKDDLDPSDFGWGFYDSGDNSVVGIRVFALKLRNGNWKKIKVESMIGGVYTMKYADLNGNNETTVAIDKADFAGSPMAYFSFETGTAVASPADWNFLFTRYLDELGGAGTPIQYQVTGVLSGPGVEVAEARYIDPSTVDYEDYIDSFDTHLDVIGQDWKYFNLTTFSWVLESDLAFFAKMPNNDLWKLVFTGFGGSTTGNFIFEKTYLGQLTGLTEAGSNLRDFGVFPNPSSGECTLSFSLAEARENVPLRMVNGLGQEVWRSDVVGHSGLNALTLNTRNFPVGIYYVLIGEPGNAVAVKISIL